MLPFADVTRLAIIILQIGIFYSFILPCSIQLLLSYYSLSLHNILHSTPELPTLEQGTLLALLLPDVSNC